MRTHIINVKLTDQGTFTVQMHADAGDIPDTICDTEMSYGDADELCSKLCDVLLQYTAKQSEKAECKHSYRPTTTKRPTEDGKEERKVQCRHCGHTTWWPIIVSPLPRLGITEQ